MKHIIILLNVMILIISCKSDISDVSEYNFKYKDLFAISDELETSLISSNEYNVLNKKLSSYNDFINYYQPHGMVYQVDYSSIEDLENIRIACIEYLMSMDDFLLSINKDERNALLCLALKKQEIKFSNKYSNPIEARQTGLHLIFKLLYINEDEATLSSISEYCDNHQFKYGIYNNKDFLNYLTNLSFNNCKYE